MNTIIFVHIPKTAGTSLTRFFHESGIKQVDADPWPLRWVRPRKHRSILEWSPALRRKHVSIAVLREPASWIVSYYKFIRFSSTSPDTGRTWKHHLYPLVHNLCLNDFVSEVCENDLFERHIFSFRHLRRLGHSRFDQTSFVTAPDGQVLVDQLFLFEHLEQQLQTFLALDALGPTLPVVNKSNPRKAEDLRLTERSQRLIKDRFARDSALYERVLQKY